MSDGSRTYRQATLWDAISGTGSRELAVGPTLFDLPGGPTTDPVIPEVAPANPSPRPARARGKKTTATSGRNFTVSSASAALQHSLASRLMELLDTNGSTEYLLTWRRKATPWGRLYCLLRASGRRTPGTGCSGSPDGWATPQASMTNTSPEDFLRRKGRRPDGDVTDLQAQAQLAPWATPTSHERTHTPRAVDHGEQLANQAALVGWPTTRGSDSDNGLRTVEGALAEYQRKGEGADLPTLVNLAPWPSPAANEFEDPDTERVNARREKCKESHINGNGFGLTLGMASHLAGWPTANATDHKGASTRSPGRERPLCDNDLPATALLSGPTAESSPASTARRVASRLNPAFSLWLMGYPPSWSSSSPGWESWVMIERLLADFYARPEGTEPAG